MNIKYYCYIFILAVTCAGGALPTDTCELPSDFLESIDQVLDKAKAELPDPIRLPPRTTLVELSDGLLWGLSNITRMGSPEVTCEGDNGKIKAKITTDQIKGRYTWTSEGKKSTWQGFVVFISDDFQADVEIVISRSSAQPRLERFDIQRFRSARVEITGLGFFTWALAEMTTLMSGIFQRAIASAVQGPLKEALERHLRDVVVN